MYNHTRTSNTHCLTISFSNRALSRELYLERSKYCRTLTALVYRYCRMLTGHMNHFHKVWGNETYRYKTVNTTSQFVDVGRNPVKYQVYKCASVKTVIEQVIFPCWC